MKEHIEILFWFCIFIVVYTYIGYGFILFFIVKIKRLFYSKSASQKSGDLPEVTHIVAAYNEEDCIRQKIENALSMDYPPDKLKLLIVTDGSNDETADIIKSYPQVEHHHENKRSGKTAAINRVIRFVKSPIIVFSDANTLLNKDAIKNIVEHFQNAEVGLVAGEKRVISKNSDHAAASGEGFYWQYESQLKKWDSELHSVIGAAGELFAVRTKLFELVDENIIIEDFYISLKLAMNGYKVAYEPDAYAMEAGSASVNEELKRKIRIAAGGIQAVVKLWPLLNPFKYGMLSFQYVSHRVLRWTLAPLALPLIFFSNTYLAYTGAELYMAIFTLQVFFYIFAAVGWSFQNNNIKYKIFFIPYYFTMMNYAVYRGFIRYILGSQSAIWDKAKRAAA